MARRGLLAACLLAVASCAQASNFAHCIIDGMKGVESAAVARAVHQSCFKAYPSGYKGIVKGSGRGWFAHKDGAACTIAEASNTKSEQAAHAISIACRCLYDENVFDQFGFRPTYCAN